jgi:hypothetical protein
LGLKSKFRLFAVDAHFGIVLGVLPSGDGFVRQIRQLQHQRIARRLGLGRLFVERGDFLAQIFRLGLFGLGLGEFFLAHERADFLAHAVALGFERFHFGQGFPALFVEPLSSSSISVESGRVFCRSVEVQSSGKLAMSTSRQQHLRTPLHGTSRREL